MSFPRRRESNIIFMNNNKKAFWYIIIPFIIWLPALIFWLGDKMAFTIVTVGSPSLRVRILGVLLKVSGVVGLLGLVAGTVWAVRLLRRDTVNSLWGYIKFVLKVLGAMLLAAVVVFYFSIFLVSWMG